MKQKRNSSTSQQRIPRNYYLCKVWLTDRLTNAEVRENYVACGNPERCTDKAIVGIALPTAFKDQSTLSYLVFALYSWGLVFIVPNIVGSWWTQIRTTDEGLSRHTAHFFLKFALEKKGASIRDLIRLFCQTEEVRREVQLVEDKFHILLTCGGKSTVRGLLKGQGD